MIIFVYPLYVSKVNCRYLRNNFINFVAYDKFQVVDKYLRKCALLVLQMLDNLRSSYEFLNIFMDADGDTHTNLSELSINSEDYLSGYTHSVFRYFKLVIGSIILEYWSKFDP